MTWLARTRLMQMTSQAFPIGGYSHSSGLESAVEAGIVHDEASVAAWIADVLAFSMGSYEIRVLCEMSAAWDSQDVTSLGALNGEFLATRESAELRSATVQMGYSMRRLLDVLPDLPDSLRAALREFEEPTLPCVWSGAAHGWGIPAAQSAAAYLYAWAENQVLVAMKSVPIGQSSGQRVLLRIGRLIADIAEALAALAAPVTALPGALLPGAALDGLADATRSNFAPGLAILCAQHETQYSRLFRS